MEKLRTVRLYGVLGARFGRVFRLAVSTPAEAVRALCVQIPGFEQFLSDPRYRYAVFYGKQNLSEEELHFKGEREDIRIAPVLAGSKQGGIFQAILGVVLIAAGVFTGGVTSAWGMALIGAGAGMAIGGVVQMLAPQAQGLSDSSGADNKPSYAFGGPVNTIAQGNPVGLLYGKRRIGGAIISGGIYAEDMQ